MTEKLKNQFEAERQRLQALQQQDRERQQADLGEREKAAKWQHEVKVAEVRKNFLIYRQESSCTSASAVLF
jgi:hypothetical protein